MVHCSVLYASLASFALDVPRAHVVSTRAVDPKSSHEPNVLQMWRP